MIKRLYKDHSQELKKEALKVILDVDVAIELVSSNWDELLSNSIIQLLKTVQKEDKDVLLRVKNLKGSSDSLSELLGFMHSNNLVQ